MMASFSLSPPTPSSTPRLLTFSPHLPPHPYSTHVAYVSKPSKITIFDTATDLVTTTFTCIDKIDGVSWSPPVDNEDNSSSSSSSSSSLGLIMATILTRSTIQIFSVKDKTWQCRISNTISGITSSSWTPSSRHVLTTNEFNGCLSVWSLIDKRVFYVNHPKGLLYTTSISSSLSRIPSENNNCNADSNTDINSIAGGNGVTFNPLDPNRMCVLVRKDGKDSLEFIAFNNDEWRRDKSFSLTTQDAVSVKYAVSGVHVIVVDSILTFGVYLYSSTSGALLYHYNGSSSSHNNSCCSSSSLGIRSTVMSPNGGTFLAIGSYDCKIRLYMPGSITGVSATYDHKHPNELPPYMKCTSYERFTENGIPLDANNYGKISSLNHDVESGGFFNVDDLEGQGKALLGMSVDGRRRRVDQGGAGGYIQGADAGAGAGAGSDPLNVANWGGSRHASSNSSRNAASLSSWGANQGQGGADIPQGFTLKLPKSLPYLTPDLAKPSPKLGILKMGWSLDGRYLASKEEHLPTTLFVWDTQGLGLCAVIVFRSVIRSFKWSPTNHKRLAIATGGNRVFLWDGPTTDSRSDSNGGRGRGGGGGVKWIDLPEEVAAVGVKWSAGGEVVGVYGGKVVVFVYADEKGE